MPHTKETETKIQYKTATRKNQVVETVNKPILFVFIINNYCIRENSETKSSKREKSDNTIYHSSALFYNYKILAMKQNTMLVITFPCL